MPLPSGSSVRLLLIVAIGGSGLGCRHDPKPPIIPVQTKKNAGAPRELTGASWFREMTASSGIEFQHVSGNSQDKPFPAANGSGAGMLDFDADGLPDLYFATGRSFPLDVEGDRAANRLYRNLGDWRFEDVTQLAGVGHAAYSAGIAVADYNNDGFKDLYVACYGNNVLYRNQGDGTFEEVSATSNADNDRWATSAGFFDADSDGALEVYVCNYAKWDFETSVFCGDRVKKVRIFCSPNTVEPEADVLLKNLSNGSFADETQACGLNVQAGRAQGMIAADLNGDGWMDLYVGNDLHANFLFINRGDGTYRDVTELSGAGYDDVGNMQAGMGVEAADVNGDGKPELFVTNFKDEQNTLYQNNGKATFADVSSRFGLSATSLPYIGWGTAFADFDLNGKLDLAVTNGHVDDNLHLMGRDVPYAVPPLLWQRRGRRFELVSHPPDSYFASDHVGRGLACGDLDNDGDEDLVITHQDAAPAVLSNEAASSQMKQLSVSIQLVGVRSNRDAIGSVVTLQAGARSQTQQIKGGGSYLSARDLRQVFAVGANEEEVEFRIRWPNRGESTINGLALGRRYIIVEAAGADEKPLVYEVGVNNE